MRGQRRDQKFASPGSEPGNHTKLKGGEGRDSSLTGDEGKTL